jgi:putative endonuclease
MRVYARLESVKREWTVYIIEAKNGFLYTGITKDLERRLREHLSVKGTKSKGAKFFRVSEPKKILAAVEGFTLSQALKAEKKIKSLNRTKKLNYLRSLSP